jgi:uncharacterized Ntn-hydrolase superfamily protein
MTFSIVGRDGSAHGVAVASKFLGAGAAVPAAEATVGAVATQAYANLAYRPQGLALLRTGVTAEATVAALLAADAMPGHRQVGVVAAGGPGATYTGPECIPWAGGRSGADHAVQGNCLAGPEVVDAMEAAWLESTGSLARRLCAALRAGDRAGGDRRGRQSAALLVVEPGGGYGGTSDVAVDLRVDDHTHPVDELHRLLDLHELYFGHPDPATLHDLAGPLAEEVATRLTALGFPDLDTWAGWENLEERLVPGKIDPIVLQILRRKA